MSDPSPAWPHAPTHILSGSGVYFVTAGTYEKDHHFRGGERLAALQSDILGIAQEYGWQLEAWAVFSNHYHFVGRSPAGESTAESLTPMLQRLHAGTAEWANRLDGRPGRQVWYNFWDTELTYQRAYIARLNYTHHNAVKHGLVAVADRYPWCSAGWFQRVASPAMAKSVYRFKIDRLNIPDAFDPAPEW